MLKNSCMEACVWKLYMYVFTRIVERMEKKKKKKNI